MMKVLWDFRSDPPPRACSMNMGMFLPTLQVIMRQFMDFMKPSNFSTMKAPE